jgi:hypothetical protein
VAGEDELVERELTLNRFKRLLGEIMRGEMPRNAFQPWEVEILMDLANCDLDSRRRLEILRQYQRAVEQQLESGPGPPMKLSEFLELRLRRRWPST